MGQRFLIAVFVTSILFVSGLAGAAKVNPAPHAAPRPAPHPNNVHPNSGHPAPNSNKGVQQGSQHPGGSPAVHPNAKGPQRTNPAMKTEFTARASKVQQHLHHNGHWHHWHPWVWGAYGYLPANAPGMVVGVPSGNTLSVTNAAGVPQSVRLAGVGAPFAGQALFQESRDNLGTLANQQYVRVFQTGFDLDGSIVAQVFLRDSGLYLNERQIHDGMAWNSVDDGYDPSLAAAEEAAQMRGGGLWTGDYQFAE